MSPKNCFTSLGFLGGNIFCILSNFSSTGAIPSPDKSPALGRATCQPHGQKNLDD